MGIEASKEAQDVRKCKPHKWLSNFHPGYIRRLKERFELAKESYTLERDDLQRLFKCKKEEVDDIFHHFDLDDDEIIDQYEFITALIFVSHSSLDEKAALIFELYDFDKSKYISKDEMTILLVNSLTSLKCLAGQQAPAIDELEKKVDSMMLGADTDNNQKITLDEFTTYIKRDAEIMKVLFAYGVAKQEDLGVNLGTEEDPYYDSDLDNETLLDDMQQDINKQNAKYGQGLIKFDEFGFPVDEDDQTNAWARSNEGLDQEDSSAVYDVDQPDATLELEHIYGYRCHDARNNLRFNCEGKVVYHAAGVGIVLNQRENKQRFMMEHDDDILCLDVDPNGRYCATGQVGLTPWLVIWDTTFQEDARRIKTPLTNGIKHVAFSHKADLIVATGMDSDHSIMVYNLKDDEIVAVGKGPSSHVWSIGFNTDDSTIIATCTGNVLMYSFSDGMLIPLERDDIDEQGIAYDDQGSPVGAVLCQASVGQILFAGNTAGTILTYVNSGCPIAKKTEYGAVYCLELRTSRSGLISGHKCGSVVMWQIDEGKLEPTFTLHLGSPDVKSVVPQVKSVCEHPKTQALLVGTRGGEIFEFSTKQKEKPKLFLKSHHRKEICGLAVHPTENKFLTVGQDCMLGVWDADQKRQNKYAKLECGANVVAYSENGQLIAIGMLNGYLLVVDSKDWGPIAKTQHGSSGQAITSIRFSPDNYTCVVGGQDGRIKIYNVESKFRKADVVKKSQNAILSIDFTKDSQYFVVTNDVQEILAFETKSGRYRDVNSLRDADWQTYTGALGKEVRGILPENGDINQILSCQRDRDGHVFATGDAYGCINLFRYPCPKPEAARSKFIGHSAGVRNIGFIQSKKLISCGGQDLSIFQWHYRFDKQGSKQAMQAAQRDGRDHEIEKLGKMLQGEKWTDSELSAFQMALARVGEQRPPNYQPSASAGLAPLEDISLKHAHGYSCQSIKGNVLLTANGGLVYTLGSLAIIQSPGNPQDFFMLHKNQEITSIDIHPDGDIIATGARAAPGKRAEVLIWRASTQELLARLSGVHKNAITAVKFSTGGKKIVTVGQDREHALVVYDWVGQSILAATSTGGGKITDAAWKNDNQFMTVGTDSTNFYTLNGKNLTMQRGRADRSQGRDFSCAFVGKGGLMCITGNQSGQLLRWDKKDQSGQYQTIGAYPGHDAPIQQLVALENQIISGGLEGRIIVWSAKFDRPEITRINVIEIQQPKIGSPGIAALAFHPADKNYIVGTMNGEIYSVLGQGEPGTVYVTGHFSVTEQLGTGKVLALAAHPNKQEFVTSGTDRCLRFWSTEKQTDVLADFADDIVAIDWSICGNFIIIGDSRGQIYSIDAVSHKTVGKCHNKQKRAGKDQVNAVKISPDSQRVAFSIAGASGIDLVTIDPSSFNLKHEKAAQVGQSVISIDWSITSEFLALGSKSALIFCDARSCKEVQFDRVIKYQWQTWTSKLGFSVQGIWSDQKFSSVTALSASRGKTFLATGQDTGTLKLFKYPCTIHNSHHQTHQGHCSPISAITFSADDKYIISAGSRDQGVLVWETAFDGAAVQEHGGEIDSEVVDDPDEVEYFTYEGDLIDRSKEIKQQMKTRRQIEAKRKREAQIQEKGGEIDEQEDQDFYWNFNNGEQTTATKIWKGYFKAPLGYIKPPKNQEKAPYIKASIEWVHGYRGNKCRNNLKYMYDGTICFNVAGLAVIQDYKQSQRHFDRHSDDVTAIAFSPNKKTVATGETGRNALIFIWDAFSMRVLQKLGGQLRKGIKCLAFSTSGVNLAACDISEDHQIAVFNVKSGACISIQRGDKSQIFGLAWCSDQYFTSVGVRHFKFWTCGKTLTSKRGLWTGEQDRSITCIAFAGNFGFTGTSKGKLLKWEENKRIKSQMLHPGGLDAITVYNGLVFTGGKDKRVVCIDPASLDVILTLDLKTELKSRSIDAQVRAIDINSDGSRLAIGTFGSEIFEFPMDSEAQQIDSSKPIVLVSGHYAPKMRDTNEVWGLCSMPGVGIDNDRYVTVSEDGTLRVWSSLSHEQILLVDLNRHKEGQARAVDPKTREISMAGQARCVDVSSSGSMCAVGFRSGQFRIYKIDPNTMGSSEWPFKKAVKSPMSKWIEDLKFSPDERYLAVSCHDTNIYIFECEKFELIHTLKECTSFVQHIDWCVNSRYLRTNDGSYELLYFDTHTGQQVTHKPRMAGAKGQKQSKPQDCTEYTEDLWYTGNCTLTWASQGIWSHGMDGSDINYCDRSTDQHPDGYKLLASADDFGQVKVFRYPSMNLSSESTLCRGHSSHVTKVKFIGPHTLVSTGGNDCSVIQWKLEY